MRDMEQRTRLFQEFSGAFVDKPGRCFVLFQSGLPIIVDKPPVMEGPERGTRGETRLLSICSPGQMKQPKGRTEGNSKIRIII